jgi:hypothetical protein
MAHPLAAIALILAACDNSTPPAHVPPSVETETPPPALAGPHHATPAPGEELPTSQTSPGLIPLEYRHVWAIDPNDCTADPGHTRIAIAPGAIRFYEGRAVVASPDESRANTLIVDVAHASEGQTTRETHTLSLDETGTTLTYTRGENTFTYTRCD